MLSAGSGSRALLGAGGRVLSRLSAGGEQLPWENGREEDQKVGQQGSVQTAAVRELAAWRSWPAHGEGRCILRTYCIQMLCFVGSSFPPCGPVSYRFLSPAFTRGKRLREKQRLPLGALRAQGSCPPPLCSWGGAQHSARELLSRTWVFWAPWSHLPNQLRGAGPA